MADKETYVVATIKSWNISNFHKISQEANWHLITDTQDLTFETLKSLNPRYVFFPHWSWLISPEIYENFECVLFHMTDLPFGRGGSPLQNLICQGIYQTKISAIRVSKGFDTGAIYFKRDLSLHGSAEEIFIRCSNIVFDMMKDIIQDEPKATEQVGEPVIFKRRKPWQSRIPGISDLDVIFDYIRMLDAEGYPPAFIETQNLRLEFSRASLKNDCILADVKIGRKP